MEAKWKWLKHLLLPKLDWGLVVDFSGSGWLDLSGLEARCGPDPWAPSHDACCSGPSERVAPLSHFAQKVWKVDGLAPVYIPTRKYLKSHLTLMQCKKKKIIFLYETFCNNI